MQEENKETEEKIIQKLVNEYSQESFISLNAEEEKKKRLKIASIAGAVFLLISFIVYYEWNFVRMKTEIQEKDSRLDELEQNITTLLMQEEEQEDEILKLKSNFSRTVPDRDLKAEVEENINTLKKSSEKFIGKNFSRGNTNFKEIALTFDLSTGDELVTVYDLIRKYDIRTTLFLSNEKPSDSFGSLIFPANVAYVKKFIALGDQVEFGNHTWSHFNHHRSLRERSLRKRLILDKVSDRVLDFPYMAEELFKVEQRFKLISGGRQLSKIYRLPYGSFNQVILNSYAKLGYQKHIFWSSNVVGSLDLPDYINKPFVTRTDKLTGLVENVKNPFYKTSSEIRNMLFNWEKKDPHGMNGAIILMHLGTVRKFDKLITVLPEFVETMQKKGYKFVTVSEVLNDKED
ncbi:MAG: polysaccharide deacetylase family protein [Leptospira sp.]|nr:polysaccharide deacetylase family protein [Leptospira sp.]